MILNSIVLLFSRRIVSNSTCRLHGWRRERRCRPRRHGIERNGDAAEKLHVCSSVGRQRNDDVHSGTSPTRDADQRSDGVRFIVVHVIQPNGDDDEQQPVEIQPAATGHDVQQHRMAGEIVA